MLQEILVNVLDIMGYIQKCLGYIFFKISNKVTGESRADSTADRVQCAAALTGVFIEQSQE